MTVSELITVLQKARPGLPVYFGKTDDDGVELHDVKKAREYAFVESLLPGYEGPSTPENFVAGFFIS
jgi:hypothetical protein